MGSDTIAKQTASESSQTVGYPAGIGDLHVGLGVGGGGGETHTPILWNWVQTAHSYEFSHGLESAGERHTEEVGCEEGLYKQAGEEVGQTRWRLCF